MSRLIGRNRLTRALFFGALDLVWIGLAIYIAFLLRFDGQISPHYAARLWIHLDQKINRTELMDYLARCGVQTRPYFSPIHLQPFYRERFGYHEGDYPVTEQISWRTLALPFYNRLSEPEINYVVQSLKEGIARG